MKRIFNIAFLIALGLFINQSAFADRYVGDSKSNNAPKTNARTGAAGCLPGKSATDLNLNNVRARINTGGDMWWDLQSKSEYFIPKNSTKTSMYNAALWMGGVDVNGQLKGAFQRYRSNGNDYWPGPLSKDGKASIDPQTCADYDKHFVITRREVDEFRLWFADPAAFPDYTVPDIIKNWPAHGDISLNQSYYLAPFFDFDGDGSYDYTQGDYPYYDIKNELCGSPNPTMEGNGILADQVLKGDQTLWWVFNDNGNIHTESKGNAIGVEIRAQAFAFSTNDVINNMTFYTYEIINRSTFRLTETYFSQWVDTDLGYAYDDFVGCDVKRGLGYCYNGKAIDGNGTPEAYGAQPPAVGVDFFQGPYMDNDGKDNPKFTTDSVGNQTIVCDESINGVNFGDGVVDNERFGMRKFLFHNNASGAMGDPTLASEYYQMLRGIWRDGTQMLYGGDAYRTGAYGPAADFMFPDLTDPCDWGTNQQPPNGPRKWTEEIAGNQPADRRFMQSAGPFTLEPGAVNYITVGIPWARASSGGPFASVELLRVVDDKCQALFDNCFKVLDGPDAPEVTIQELDKEIIIYLSNIKGSNNYKEQYEEYDVTIPPLNPTNTASRYDSTYNFQGYMIYQLKTADVSVADLYDLDQSRLVAQCDIKDSVTMIVNLYKDDKSGFAVPQIMVEGENSGIRHSFKITEDKFATGNTALVNHKKYYYVAIAYGFNEYLEYDQDPNNLNGLSGQQVPFLAGRKSALGPIKVVTAIPHITSPEASGTVINSNYGDGPQVTRLDGMGNGGMEVELTDASIAEILANGRIENPVYQIGKGPINIKVIDPLSVTSADYRLDFKLKNSTLPLDSATWYLYEEGILVDSAESSIAVSNEQLLLDRGISITVGQILYPGDKNAFQNGVINSSISYKDSSVRWLSGVPDSDGSSITELNWIRSGVLEDNDDGTNNDYNPGNFVDEKEYYEKLIGGTWTAFRMASIYADGPAGTSTHAAYKLSILHSVNVVLTPDKSLWTRCPVIETSAEQAVAEGNRKKLALRAHYSIDKEGNYATSDVASSDPNSPNYISGVSMGWFPGYAIDMETGERLNMMFGESSWLVGENGRDMKFNPTNNYFTPLSEVLFGGKHHVYVFRHSSEEEGGCPAYDGGQWIYNMLWDNGTYNPNNIVMMKIFREIMWTATPMATDMDKWLDNEVTVKLRVGVPYQKGRWYYDKTGSVYNGPNGGLPSYGFTTKDIATSKAVGTAAESALDLIAVVPNPYYAYSDYETSQLDNRVKIVNLPENCTVKIYNMNGTLVRTFTKDNNLTFLEWDLKNQASIPIASGTYIIHIDAPGIGEKVVKWFGALRPVDLNAF
jgi:hypothetical protein